MESTIIYIRTSTEEQNPQNQLKDCESINTYGSYELYEEKQSAWKDNIAKRDKFREIINAIKQNKVNHLIVWDLDRIYRKRTKIVEFLKFCKAYNCSVHSYRQKWLEELYKIPTPWNEIVSDMLIQVMGWMAEEESNKKSERIKVAIRKKNDITVSYKGNKWGRKSLSQNTVDMVLELREQGKSIRDIQKEVFYWDTNNNRKQISRGSVHKILQANGNIGQAV